MGQFYAENRLQEIGDRLNFVDIVDNARIGEGELVLINRDHPIRRPLDPGNLASLDGRTDLRALTPGMLLDKTCLRRLAALLRESRGTERIVAVSGYRSMEEQVRIYESSFAENGPAYTAKYVALPDRSEHQTGLAVDVGAADGDLDFIAPSFPDEGAALTFKKLAAKHGFVQRYKEGKEALTRISCEPWHFRYVGFPHASLMEINDWCLEEYVDRLARYRYDGDWLSFEEDGTSAAVYFVPAEDGPTTAVPIADCEDYSLSGNNRDGFIVTVFTSTGR